MKRLKEIFFGIIIVLVFGWLITYIYRFESNRSNRELARRINELSPRGGGPPESIEGLRQAIELYEIQIERNVREGAQTGIYWKILAMRLADRNMHNDALDALERAIFFNTQDAVLFYLAGISAANVAKSKVGFSGNMEQEREHYFRLSENSYLRALELDITYTRAMYALAVLYVFELARPQDAIYHLERLLQLTPSDIPSLFVLAAAHYMLENYLQAVEIYDRIASNTRDARIREEALSNRDIIRGRMF